MRIRTTLTTATLLATLALTPATVHAKPPEHRPWTIAYVMSYDNDLARHTDAILAALERGVADTELAVTVLVDTRDKHGLRRVAITEDGRGEERMLTDDSTDTAALAEFIEWTKVTYPSDRFAMVFLNHGGGLDEMCWDWRPAAGKGASWMSGRGAADALRTANANAALDTDLLFLQQCGRGSAGNLHVFKDSATWVMASQTRVGAPNTYYEKTLKWLADNPDAEGDDLAKTILDEDAHYASMSLFHGSALADIAKRLRPVVDVLRGSADDPPTAPGRMGICYGGVEHVEETAYDLMEWLEAAARKRDDAAREAVQEFRKWLDGELVERHMLGPLEFPGRTRWCGVSLFVPVPEKVRDRNADHPFLIESGLGELFAELYPTD